ncbi:BQ5605_C038g11692 [Microbotryum silenes-dioicae]|uniref:BQ5605_C038g11692 protein n=1 Tax=Microbotryum silenes-dioicae TaxID=796604 RepID=A0A2X0PFY5_9BASI|nr:BQ5605_C038g11692 [Microbotryum silenes-dioicae]
MPVVTASTTSAGSMWPSYVSPSSTSRHAAAAGEAARTPESEVAPVMSQPAVAPVNHLSPLASRPHPHAATSSPLQHVAAHRLSFSSPRADTEPGSYLSKSSSGNSMPASPACAGGGARRSSHVAQRSVFGFIVGHHYTRIDDGPPLIPVAPPSLWAATGALVRYPLVIVLVTCSVSLFFLSSSVASLWNGLSDSQGNYRNGSNIDVFQDYNISAPDGSAIATFIGLGATLTSCYVKDKNGHFRDVVLGYDGRRKYLTDLEYAYYGAVVGRYANRIKNATFSIPPLRQLDEPLPPGATVYKVAANEQEGKTALHVGKWGYSRAGWSLVKHEADRITFGLRDRGAEGFPGTVHVLASYTLGPDAVWTTRLSGQVKTGKATPMMMSSHVYWNLDGYGYDTSGAVGKTTNKGALDHVLKIKSSSYVSTDEILVPSGSITRIASNASPLDFRKARTIGSRFSRTDGVCGGDCTGYDTCFIYDQSAPREPVMELISPVRTNQPAVQVYTCNHQGSTPRKHSHGGPDAGFYEKHSCVVLEQQGRIGAIREPEWGEDQVYTPSRAYDWWSEYSFSTV